MKASFERIKESPALLVNCNYFNGIVIWDLVHTSTDQAKYCTYQLPDNLNKPLYARL